MARYINNIFIKQTDTEKRHYSTALPGKPAIIDFGETYVSQIGDRWDLLASRFLGSARFWYAVAIVNGGANGSIFIKPGTTIKIPQVI